MGNKFFKENNNINKTQNCFRCFTSQCLSVLGSIFQSGPFDLETWI